MMDLKHVTVSDVSSALVAVNCTVNFLTSFIHTNTMVLKSLKLSWIGTEMTALLRTPQCIDGFQASRRTVIAWNPCLEPYGCLINIDTIPYFRKILCSIT